MRLPRKRRRDAFEGFSRSNAYVFQRPAVLVICLLALLLLGLVGEQIIAWTLWLGWGAIQAVYSFSAQAVGGASEPVSTYQQRGTGLVGELILAYWFSYFWAAAGAVYLVLRRSVDDTDLHPA